MATPVNYSPQSVIARAMFNFDAFGEQNFVLSGTVRVSVSDSFSSSDYLSPGYSAFYGDLWTSGSGEVIWTAAQLSNIQDVLAIYSQYANISFQWKGNYDVWPSGSDTTFNPEDVGRSGLSDINISLISRTDADFSGISGASADSFLGYTGGAEDIFVNSVAFGDLGFGAGTKARQTLLHELGHSLGMSHPHVDYDSTNDVATVSADFAATRYLGFENLGFRSASAADMNKEYFTIMSYDDQLSLSSAISFNAHTPMILDVIALQEAYGEGTGTTGAGNDTIEAGTIGYRTYFDKGGIDTIDLTLYSSGAYLNMGENITGAPHKLGVSMSLYDARSTIVYAGDPQHLRWFYGEYENAVGSAFLDMMVDNSLDNAIRSGDGDDLVMLGAGDDLVDGGAGTDVASYFGARRLYVVSGNNDGSFSVRDTRGTDGTDTLTMVERIEFSDANVALDLNGNAGITAKILGAVFGASTVSDMQYVGIGLYYLDNGMSYQSLMQLALDARLGTGFSNDAEVALLYRNLAGIAPSQDDLAYWSGTIASEQYTRASLAVMAADTSLNASNIQLTGLASTGIEYFPVA